jgi:beta-carotene 3-hydroxylase
MLVLNILIMLAAFALMEFVAWFTHKYVMHGILWILHRDHHQPEHHSGFFERNDAFFLIFAIPGMLFIFLGYANGWMDPRLWIGIGITLYGMSYLFVHDIFVHQRFKIFKKTNNIYFMALRKAHKIHHKHLQKEDGECFGILWVPRQYFQEAKQTKLRRQNVHIPAR